MTMQNGEDKAELVLHHCRPSRQHRRTLSLTWDFIGQIRALIPCENREDKERSQKSIHEHVCLGLNTFNSKG